MIKKCISLIMLTTLILTIGAPASAQLESIAAYSDVPAWHWAASYIETATADGLMQGNGNQTFGLGQSMTRADFVTVLCRMFGWKIISPSSSSFTDCSSSEWYYSYVETALANDAIPSDSAFRPNDKITRDEMAVMLVRGLGYDTLAQSLSANSPFSDVTSDVGYISMAYRMGLITGITKNGKTTFQPDASATREQAAAMLVRVYSRYTSKLSWLHGFYALSAYSQINLTAKMDAVSLGWSSLTMNDSGTPTLNTTSANGNSWAIPQSSDTALTYFKANHTPYNLNVYADEDEILASSDSRKTAIDAIVSASSGYSGVTIDFEKLFASNKDNFTAFMTALRKALPSSQTLYVCVCPVTLTKGYYDGYDYRALGDLCDKVILMAHDYQVTTLPDSDLGTDQSDTPLTPIKQVYSALVAITDPNTGVSDVSKVALALSFTGVAWKVDSNGDLLSTSASTPSLSTMASRLSQSDTVINWSKLYQNPFAFYTTDSGSSRYRLWYEDSRSVQAKVALARMFGITGISLWRIGSIPNGDANVYWNVWDTLLSDR
jgi:spore germination protein YaaH